MRDCVHNEEVGLRNRYLRDIGKPVSYDKKILDSIVTELANLIKKKIDLDFLPIPDLKEFYDERAGHSKQRLGKAINDVIKKGYDPIKDSKIKSFIKLENYENDDDKPFQDILKEPRMIMGRDPKFGLTYGRYTTALEKIVMELPGFKKGKNFFEQGEFVEKHPQENYQYYFDDASKFESSQREQLLRDIELGLWQQILSPHDFSIMQLLFELKMIKSGYTKHMIKFCFYALRCSGEFDTLLFNTVLNWAAHRYFEIVNKIPDYNFVVTGDDGIGAYPKGMLNFVDTFPTFGFECELIFVKDPIELEFCSAKFIEYHPGKWMLCPNIPKLLRNVGVIKNKDFDKCIGHFYYSLGYMYKVMFPNFPFFTELSTFLMGITKNPKVKCVNIDHLRYLNPMYVDIFRNGSIDVLFNYNLFTTGMQMAYGLQRSALHAVYDYFDSVEISMPGCDNRFNKKGASAPTFTYQQASVVESLLVQRLIVDRKRVLRLVARIKEG
jgi:hypothetical protein